MAGAHMYGHQRGASSMVNITFNNIAEGEIQTAILRVTHFAGQWPDRVGARNGCIYGTTGPTVMGVHRTPTGRLVITGIKPEEGK
jgi:hypothetical protein